jgi:hypothetical protein
MANSDIIGRLERILDRYEAGELRPEQVEDMVPQHIEALEALPYQRI